MNKVLQTSSPALREALLATGIRTVASLMTCDVDAIAKRTRIPKEELLAARKSICLQYSSFPICATDILDSITSTFCILPTGCDNLDELLDGGLYSGEVTELVGAAGSGKTQACMSIAASVALNQEKNILYIDTGSAFSSQRVREMLYGKDTSLTEQETADVLARLRCIHAFDVFTVLECLETTKQNIYKEEDTFYRDLQLIIVDSVAAIITPILGGQQITGHALMVHLSRHLKSLAVDNSLIVLVTNNVVSDSSGAPCGVKPALGQTWSHIPNTRVFIQKGWPVNKLQNKQSITEEWRATLTKSSREPLQVSTAFSIGNAGILNLPSR